LALSPTRPPSTRPFPFTTLFRSLPAVSARYPEAMTIAGADDAAAITEAEGVEIAHTVDHLDVGDFGGFVLQAICLRGQIAWRTKDRKSTRLNSSHVSISYAVFCL